MFDYEDESNGDLTAAVGAILVGESETNAAMIEAGTFQLAVEIARMLPHEVGATTALTALEAAVVMLRGGVDYAASRGQGEPVDLLAIRASTLAKAHTMIESARIECEIDNLKVGYSAPGGDA